jgi:hypothetical protein
MEYDPFYIILGRYSSVYRRRTGAELDRVTIITAWAGVQCNSTASGRK